jgi:hypothetical protein
MALTFDPYYFDPEDFDAPYGEVVIDAVSLPHVQEITVRERTAVGSKPLPGGGLPFREQTGKYGREVTISGWTDSLTLLGDIEALADGTERTLVIPTAQTFKVHVTQVLPNRKAEDYDRYTYELEARELVD